MPRSTRTKKLPDHLRMGNTSTGAYALICCHCGAIYVPSLPISIEMFLKVSRQFGVEHRACKVPATGMMDADLLLQRAGLRHLRNLEEQGTTWRQTPSPGNLPSDNV